MPIMYCLAKIAETLGLSYESLQASIQIFVLWVYYSRVIKCIQHTFISAKYLIGTNTRLNVDPTLWAQQFFESAVHLQHEELASRDDDEASVHDWARAAFAIVMSNHYDVEGSLDWEFCLDVCWRVWCGKKHENERMSTEKGPNSGKFHLPTINFQGAIR